MDGNFVGQDMWLSRERAQNIAGLVAMNWGDFPNWCCISLHFSFLLNFLFSCLSQSLSSHLYFIFFPKILGKEWNRYLLISFFFLGTGRVSQSQRREGRNKDRSQADCRSNGKSWGHWKKTGRSQEKWRMLKVTKRKYKINECRSKGMMQEMTGKLGVGRIKKEITGSKLALKKSKKTLWKKYSQKKGENY